jgi:hypothetical protein
MLHPCSTRVITEICANPPTGTDAKTARRRWCCFGEALPMRLPMAIEKGVIFSEPFQRVRSASIRNEGVSTAGANNEAGKRTLALATADRFSHTLVVPAAALDSNALRLPADSDAIVLRTRFQIRAAQFHRRASIVAAKACSWSVRLLSPVDVKRVRRLCPSQGIRLAESLALGFHENRSLAQANRSRWCCYDLRSRSPRCRLRQPHPPMRATCSCQSSRRLHSMVWSDSTACVLFPEIECEEPISAAAYSPLHTRCRRNVARSRLSSVGLLVSPRLSPRLVTIGQNEATWGKTSVLALSCVVPAFYANLFDAEGWPSGRWRWS